MGIQFCSNEGPRPIPKVDNNEIVQIQWQNLNIFFSRTTEPISTKLLGEEDWSFYKEETINSQIRDNVFSLLINVMV